MNSVVRLAIVDPKDTSRNAIKSLLMGLDTIWLEAECSRYDFFADVAKQTQPDIALISLDSDPSKALALVGKIAQDLPNTNVLVVSSSQEGSLILQAMRNGAKEFLSFPLRLEDFVAAIDRMQTQRGGRNDNNIVRSSRVITVAGVSGGVGCTSLAINLACILAKNERNSVAIIDLDFALGDADVWLDIIPVYTIQDVAENISRLDYALLKRSLTRHACGAFLLPRPVQMDDHNYMTPEQLRRVIALLKATFTHLIIDVSKNYGPLDITALELSDVSLLVTQLDLPCLRNVVRLMQYFEQREGLTQKIKIVINRQGLEDTQISLGKALETIGREISWTIPNDYATMVEARNNGIPLMEQAPRAKITKAIEALALAVGDAAPVKIDGEEKEKKVKRGIFSFLGSGK